MAKNCGRKFARAELMEIAQFVRGILTLHRIATSFCFDYGEFTNRALFRSHCSQHTPGFLISDDFRVLASILRTGHTFVPAYATIGTELFLAFSVIMLANETGQESMSRPRLTSVAFNPGVATCLVRFKVHALAITFAVRTLPLLFRFPVVIEQLFFPLT